MTRILSSVALRRYAPAMFLSAIVLLGSATAHAQRISVCCSVPDLASLVQAIGGGAVSVTTFAKGSEDPHFLEAKPSYVRALNQAHLLVMLGLGMEDGWSPVVLQNARNGNVLPGAAGYLDASRAIKPLDVPTGTVDRSMGDVHAGGNPHYLLDPLCGLQVARLIRDKLSELQPGLKATFDENYNRLRQTIDERLVGPELAAKYKPDDIPKLALLFEYGKLQEFLTNQNQEALLGGWLKELLPYYGAKVVDDHNMWPYFARRFGLKVIAHMEPKPGITPTTQHLAAVAQQARAAEVRVILANPYYDPRHAQFLASQTGARVVNIAHQVGSRPGTDDYVSLVDYNVRQIVAALGNK